VEKSKQEPAGIRERSRDFREKVQGEDRDPLHQIAVCGDYSGDDTPEEIVG
jgi:hypothetical protein